MAQRLHDIQPGEVSLVRRGANRRPFFLAKAESELTDVAADVLAEPSKTEAVYLAAVEKAGGDNSVRDAAAMLARTVGALREAFGKDGVPAELRKAMDDDLDADGEMDDDQDGAGGDNDDDVIEKADADREHAIYKRDFTAEQRRQLAAKGHALPDGSYPIESKADIGPALTLAQSGHGDAAAAKALIRRRAKELGAQDQLPENFNKEDGSMTETAQAVPVKKEDGSWDLSAVPEDQRAGFEAFIKAHDDEVEELRKAKEAEETKADEAIRIAKAEQEKRETTEAIAKSAALEHLAKSDDEFGPVLRDIAKAEQEKHLPEGTVAKLDEVLKAADEQVAKGALYRELGQPGGFGDTDVEKQIEAKAEEIRKADTSLSKEQAFAKALDQNPDLYDQYRKEVA